MKLLARLQTGRLSSWIVVVLGLVVLSALFAVLPKSTDDSAPSSAAPGTADSSKVAAILEDFPGADRSAAIFVISTTDGAAFTDAQTDFVAEAAARLAELSDAPQAVRPQLDDRGATAVIVVPVTATDDTETLTEQVSALRGAATADRPDGVEVYLTGPVGFQIDILDAFAGADIRLLLITAGIVAVLLIVTYRSPVLWLVPLIVVAAGDGLARFVVSAIAAEFGIPVDASILGILSVLVFGAGTNYALLLIARYREGLLAEPDRRVAMQRAVTGAGPAILASGGTVALSLSMLLFASLSGNQALGFACAVGIVIALALSLLLLPAALVVCGRGLFWPFVPRPGSRAVTRTSLWGRIGSAVARRPAVVAVTATAVLIALAAGLAGAGIGLARTDQFLGSPESVRGEAVLSDAFGEGFGNSLTVLVDLADAESAAATAREVPGVTDAVVGDTADGWTRVDIAIDAGPQTDAAFAIVRDLRAAYASDGDTATRPLVGGIDATALDVADAAAHDRALVIPLILLVVFLVLLVLLRSLVAPVLLLATVLLTFFASLGAANVLFQNALGFAAFDTSVPLYAFLFLVALGVDYNIFLTTRAREERTTRGARDGMSEALTRTGAVITSAGILLAAVFVVLGVLPVVALAQIGTIVCIGILLDTLIVRTVLVPALAFLLGERFWWPSRVGPEYSRGTSIDPAITGELSEEQRSAAQ